MNKILKIFFKYSLLFSYGGMIYVIIELLYRQYSDVSMMFCGGLCFVLVGLLNEIFPQNKKYTPLLAQAFAGAFFIVTPIEYIFGYIFNKDYHIWDYRELPLNYHGQICLLFSLLWVGVCILAIILDDYLRYYIFNQSKPKYRLK